MSNYTLDRFQQLEQIGKGSYGKVIKVKDSLSNKYYALKQTFNQSPQNGVQTSTLREIEIAQKLQRTNHPELFVKLITVINQNDQLYLLYELGKQDLRSWLQQRIKTYDNQYQTPPYSQVESKGYDYLPLNIIIGIMKQVILATNTMHSLNIQHRDISTSNIFVFDEKDDYLQVKLADYGLSQQMYFRQNNEIMDIQQLYFRAPEVLFHTANCTNAVDIWSLGILMSTLINQSYQPIFKGHDDASQILSIYQEYGQNYIQIQRNQENRILLQPKIVYQRRSMNTQFQQTIQIVSQNIEKVQVHPGKIQRTVQRFCQKYVLEDTKLELNGVVIDKKALQEEMTNFLTEMLQIDPQLRQTTDQLLQSQFLQIKEVKIKQ